MESSEEDELAGASFEDVLGRLEQVVERLEGGDLPLEQALTAFEQGVRLSRVGAERLDDAERRVEELLSADPVRLRPLDLSGEEP